VVLSDKVMEGVATNLASAAALCLLAQLAGVINEPPRPLTIVAIAAAFAAVLLFVLNVDFHRKLARDAVADPGPWQPALVEHLPQEERDRAHAEWQAQRLAHARHAERRRSFTSVLRLTALLLAGALLGGVLVAYAAGIL